MDKITFRLRIEFTSYLHEQRKLRKTYWVALPVFLAFLTFLAVQGSYLIPLIHEFTSFSYIVGVTDVIQ